MGISNLSTGLRPGVCTSTTRPSTPFEGQMIYETDTDLTYIYGGSSWQQVSGGTAVGNSGLVYITSSSVGTGSTVTVANCFSTTYNSYRIVFDNLKVASGTIFITTQLRASGSTNNSGYYDSRLEVTVGGSVASAGSSNASSWTTPIVGDATYPAGSSIDIYNPFNSVQTTYSATGVDSRTNGAPYRAGGGWHNSTTQFTDIVFTASTNFSTGTITVYGYRK